VLDQRITKTYIELADTLVLGFDIIEFLQTLTERCVELLDTDAAGILLADQRGTLSLMAASTEQVRLLELFQLQNEEGPCLDCYRTGQGVESADVASEARRWPRFTVAARERGFAAVRAVPMRLRDQTVGAMNLFRHVPRPFSADVVAVAQSFADMATISILQIRALAHSELMVEQLQTALNSRILIEQAKGILSARRRVGIAEAFTLMRSYARTNNRLLSQVAQAIIAQSPEVAGLTSPPAQSIGR
jgi:GAF domain-containing protein